MEDGKQLVEEGEINEEDDKENGEDIPDNFFDDFNNEGFMESLQIVDSLDDITTSEIEEESENNHAKQRDVRDESSDRKKHRTSKDHKRSRSWDRKFKRESPSKKRKFDNLAQRRDPDKTKRDLENDRVKFFKKKEQKVISKIIETGLVPPGMESEVNLSSIETDRKKGEKEIIEKRKSDSNEYGYKGSRERRRSISRDRKSLNSRERVSRERRRSMSREKKRKRSRSRSYGRYRSRSRDRKISVDSRKSYEKRQRSRSRGRYSPNRRRRSRSISDRERWMRERDRSPEKKYLKEKKMSFLEEIKMKLNGNLGGDTVSYPNPKNPVQPQFPQDIYSVTAPQYNQNYLMNETPLNYNEEFFIGNQCMAGMKPEIPQMMPVQVPPVNVVNPMDNTYANTMAPVPHPGDTSDISAKVSELIARISASTKSSFNQTENSLQKVDKPLSLTDFLHINPAPEFSSNAEALKKKVDVLSRCQDFLKEISWDKQSTGKLKVTKTSYPKNTNEKNMSPLLRHKPLKFSFNTPLSNNSYQEILNRALIKAGVATEVIDLVDDDDDEDSTSPSTSVKKKVQYDFDADRKMSKMCQTDPTKCEDCEKRKNIEYKSIGIQCGESERYNVGVQVIEEDILNSTLKKNQSLAYMTPAQLLGKSETVSARADNFSAPPVGRMLPAAYRDGPDWNRPRNYYDDPTARDYYGISQQRYPRY